MTRPAVRTRKPSATPPPRVTAELLADLAHRLTERDRKIIELVWEHRVLTTHQLSAIFFSSATKARHRLLELYRMAVLERMQPWTPIGTLPWHWVLGPAGAHVLAAQRGIDLAELSYRRTTALSVCHSRQLGHLVGVNDFFAALHRHARTRTDDTQLAAWWSQRRCAALWGDLVRPDAFGQWIETNARREQAALDFFLEHDTGSESLTKVAAKLDGYAALAESSGISTIVLFWLPSAAREANLRKHLNEHPRPVPVATAVQTPLTHPQGPAGPLWLPLPSPGPRLRLAELTDAEYLAHPDER